MDHTAHQRRYPWLIGFVALAALAVGVVAFGLGRSGPAPVDRLPGSPVQGMADPNAPALSGGGDGVAGRPVLQVTTGADAGAPGSAGSLPADGSPAGASAATESAAVPVPSSTTAPSADPSTTDPGSGPTSTTVAGDPSTTTSPPEGDADLTAIELEMARLTNELRTNPNGPLRREGAVIDCDGRIPIDPATGQYQPVEALIVDPVASVQVARVWSSQLTTELQHRPQAGIAALQGAGIEVTSAGENIAYHNFSDTASRHFAGWRESDGHFCNMMDPTFTHVGVGEVTRSDGFSFATQNFFAIR